MLRRNVLIFHLGALGDFVLTWPLAMALGRLHPQSRIFYVTHGSKGELAGKLLGVEAMDIEKGWHHLFGDAGALPAEAAEMLRSAHSVYSFIAEEGSEWARNVRRVAPEAEVCCLSPRPAAGALGHVMEHLVGQLESRRALAEAVRQMLKSVADRGVGKVAASENGAVLIHPGSGAVEKCWPAERFLELGEALTAKGIAVRYVLGEVEQERWGSELIERFKAAGETVFPRSYIELYEALKDAGLFVGNDSGPGHLAAMLGVRTVLLFGPTDPGVWRPLGPRVGMMRHEPLGELGVGAVLKALESVGA